MMQSGIGIPLALAVLLAIGCAACAPTALSTARSQMAAGQYAAARQNLLQAKAKANSLSPEERREMQDDLCTASFMLGRPQVPLVEQRRECAEAAAAPGSQSSQLLVKIDEESRTEAIRQVENALKAGDLPAAESAALEYRAIAGSDPHVLAKWAAQMWQIANQQTVAAKIGKRALTPAIAQLRRSRANVRAMNDQQFAHWIRTTGTIDGTPLIDRVQISNGALTLWIAETGMSRLALHLDRLTAINDAFIARCGCNARTDVGVAETGFPAYLVRLDPETRMSEVLILPRGQVSELPAPPV